jgi:hypothetical protein
MTDGINWTNQRELEVALTTGLRVVETGSEGRCQVETLGKDKNGAVVVVGVTPGDPRHLALWLGLMTPEGQWGTAPALLEGNGHG